jgi:hypothetical protein
VAERPGRTAVDNTSASASASDGADTGAGAGIVSTAISADATNSGDASTGAISADATNSGDVRTGAISADATNSGDVGANDDTATAAAADNGGGDAFGANGGATATAADSTALAADVTAADSINCNTAALAKCGAQQHVAAAPVVVDDTRQAERPVAEVLWIPAGPIGKKKAAGAKKVKNLIPSRLARRLKGAAVGRKASLGHVPAVDGGEGTAVELRHIERTARLATEFDSMAVVENDASKETLDVSPVKLALNFVDAAVFVVRS